MLRIHDEVALEVKKDKLTISKPSVPGEGTIEYLFRNYSGECFTTELTNPAESVGEEKW